MNWLIAPNAFKGSLEADDAADIIQELIQARNKEDIVNTAPIADGGDGTCYLLNQQLGLEKFYARVSDPLGRAVDGFFGYDPITETAYLDVSTVSGIKWLSPSELNPWLSSSFGTGELILEAITKGAKNIVLGLGGSATVDMGTGILAALGIIFLDEEENELSPFSAQFLQKIKRIQINENIPSVTFTCLCDVSNPFFGDKGAIPVFGPQKGLKPEDHSLFVESAKDVYHLFEKVSENAIHDQPSFGAAGGIALGLSAFFPTKMAQGAQFFFEKIGIEKMIANVDVIVTGEGRYDSQSADGKGSFELLQLARKHNKKVWLITSGNEADEAGFDEVIKLANMDFNLPNIKNTAIDNLKIAVIEKLNEKGL
ncbi:glycerate kinase [Cyclobacterium qasimii]|uniref:Glycerate kinase n=2 Tax=Cyclobacterium qasimii TaxID=1350429 RepID=S7V4N3_9BACT|nr:glycerate kinase [Cyclobacterium qasimii]EPR65030.1 hypothetical protein ADICYQ_5959 [Cyclobacterium qasimii M12-11B]GEO20858.1 glycerate kinase [Cyclobacterium qasimii]